MNRRQLLAAVVAVPLVKPIRKALLVEYDVVHDRRTTEENRRRALEVALAIQNDQIIVLPKDYVRHVFEIRKP